VVYESEAHARAAYDSYNGVALDGLKMAIKVVAEKAVARDGSFKLSSGREVSGRRGGGVDSSSTPCTTTQPRGRGTTGRLKSAARIFGIE